MVPLAGASSSTVDLSVSSSAITSPASTESPTPTSQLANVALSPSDESCGISIRTDIVSAPPLATRITGCDRLGREHSASDSRLRPVGR